jgi:4-pyridoxate dehydrogenase
MWKHRMFDWGYDSENEEGLQSRRLTHLRGKVLGGSSSVNVMTFTRGHPGDYDRWERNGATGWSYADVLPYFKRIESWEGGESSWRGGSGPIGVQFARTTDPLFDALLAAGQAVGFPVTDDYNGAKTEGFGRSQYSIRDGRRSSSSRAYLRPIMRRTNLTVRTDALAHRVVITGDRAHGVEYSCGGSTVLADASREVLLCGGAFNTPQVLMLSGVGPADHLRKLGITPLIDLPVGANLQDHLGVPVQWQRRSPGPFQRLLRFDRISVSMARAYLFGTGPGTVVPGGLHAFLKTSPNLAVPDIEFMFRAAPPDADMWFPIVSPAYQDGYQVSAGILHPESRGEVRLKSADPRDPVLINNRFLSAPSDLEKLRQGVRLVREMGRQTALDDFRGDEVSPGPSIQSDLQIDTWIRANARTVSHPSSTCPMGNVETAVLDPDLRVRGVNGLRVIDASAMPDLVSAHINACVIMMAEKAADIIRTPQLNAQYGAR